MAYLPPHLAASTPGGDRRADPRRLARLDPSTRRPDEGELVYRGPERDARLRHGPVAPRLGPHGATSCAPATWPAARPDGLYEIVGRTSRFAKIAGLRIDLDDLEVELRGVGFATVCASDDRRLVVGVAGPSADLDAVAAAAAARCGLPHGRCGGRPVRRAAPPAQRQARRRARAGCAADAAVSPAPPCRTAGRRRRPVGAPRRARPPPRAPARADAWTATTPSCRSVATRCPTSRSRSGSRRSSATCPTTGTSPRCATLVPPDAGAAAPARRRVETSIVVRALAIVLIVGNHVGQFHAPRRRPHAARRRRLELRPVRARPRRPAAQRGPHRGAQRGVARARVAHRHAPDRPRPRPARCTAGSAIRGPTAATGTSRRSCRSCWPRRLLLAVPAGGRRRPPASLRRRRSPWRRRARPALRRRGRPHRPSRTTSARTTSSGSSPSGGRVRRPARSCTRLLVSGLLVAGLPGYFDEPHREVVVLVALLARRSGCPTIRLPRVLVRPVAHLAAASLAIYLTHWQVFPPVRDGLGPRPGGRRLAGRPGWRRGGWCRRSRGALRPAGPARGRPVSRPRRRCRRVTACRRGDRVGRRRRPA